MHEPENSNSLKYIGKRKSEKVSEGWEHLNLSFLEVFPKH